MEIGRENHKSLLLINDNVINDVLFKKLCENCLASLMKKPEIHNTTSLYNSKPDVIKEVYAALLRVTAEFARHDYSKSQVHSILIDEFKFNNQKADFYAVLYDQHKENLQSQLRLIGTHLPHIFDIHWKIEHIIKSSGLVIPDGPQFQICLSTEVYDTETKAKRIKNIKFTCNTIELQDLVYKLKDAVKHCEKIAVLSNEH